MLTPHPPTDTPYTDPPPARRQLHPTLTQPVMARPLQPRPAAPTPYPIIYYLLHSTLSYLTPPTTSIPTPLRSRTTPHSPQSQVPTLPCLNPRSPGHPPRPAQTLKTSSRGAPRDVTKGKDVPTDTLMARTTFDRPDSP
ncbi:uncharacterized protein LOC135096684 [Scylla paramamosain]|uniref:uncharacterized protein LOC135096684 n=1 Tax=Scylla paramamosain TaxID=85552 RepID=UPI0030829C28